MRAGLALLPGNCATGLFLQLRPNLSPRGRRGGDGSVKRAEWPRVPWTLPGAAARRVLVTQVAPCCGSVA